MPARAPESCETNGGIEDQQRREREEQLREPDLQRARRRRCRGSGVNRIDDRHLARSAPHDRSRLRCTRGRSRTERPEAGRTRLRSRCRSSHHGRRSPPGTASGSVTMSPSAVTMGAETESRSHPRRCDSTASPTVHHQDEHRAEHAADDRDRDEAPRSRSFRRAERGRGELARHASQSEQTRSERDVPAHVARSGPRKPSRLRFDLERARRCSPVPRRATERTEDRCRASRRQPG